MMISIGPQMPSPCEDRHCPLLRSRVGRNSSSSSHAHIKSISKQSQTAFRSSRMQPLLTISDPPPRPQPKSLLSSLSTEITLKPVLLVHLQPTSVHSQSSSWSATLLHKSGHISPCSKPLVAPSSPGGKGKALLSSALPHASLSRSTSLEFFQQPSSFLPSGPL